MITSENIHFWGAKNPFKTTFITDIPAQGLVYFSSIDNAVNFLYLKGFKKSAREINKQFKG